MMKNNKLKNLFAQAKFEALNKDYIDLNEEVLPAIRGGLKRSKLVLDDVNNGCTNNGCTNNGC